MLVSSNICCLIYAGNKKYNLYYYTIGITLDNLELSPGLTYYSSLTACNAAGLCSTAVSDGVMPDPTPPHAGVIKDGPGPEDADYMSSKLVWITISYTCHGSCWSVFLMLLIHRYLSLTHGAHYAIASLGLCNAMSRGNVYMLQWQNIGPLAGQP